MGAHGPSVFFAWRLSWQASLSKLDGPSFKGRWRLHFVNEQGLDEAGIDEFGLFREFMEEVLCRPPSHSRAVLSESR